MIDSFLLYLSDFLMFTPEIWARLLTRYHQDMWPLPLFTVLLGGFLLWLIYYRPQHCDRMINAGLCVCWLWVGFVFHFNYFSTITWAAFGFAGLFILQALLYLCFGVMFNKLQYQDINDHSLVNKMGVFIVVFSLIAFPLLTGLHANDWSQAHVFGLSPDATCLVSIGFILCAKPVARGFWLILPLVWCVINVAQRIAIAQ